MKKFGIVLAVIATVGLNAFGEAAGGGSDLKVGVTAGTSLSKIQNSAAVAYETKAGFVGGANIEYRLMEWLYVQPELLFMQKKAAIGALVTTYNYLEVPALVKAKFGSDMVMGEVHLGPELGLKLTSGGGAKSIDFGLAFGGGVDFNVAPNVDIYLNGRYVLGLVDITDPAAASTNKRRTILILAGARFGI